MLKAFEEKNLLVPVVGDFAGPKALRAVGKLRARARRDVVTAFYVSNVEQYLFQDGAGHEFARNVATLPVDDESTFIRSVSTRFGYRGALHRPGRPRQRARSDSDVRPRIPLGKIQTYYDVNVRSK